MPKSSVLLLAREFQKERRDTVRHTAMVYALTDAFDVSSEAATIRLKDMGFIPKDDMTDYNLLAGFLDTMNV
jgi:Zn-dependent peptidase ImmA (M78 family)